MRKFVSILSVMMALATTAFAVDNISPFKGTLQDMLTSRTNGTKVYKYARATYDPSVNGGTVGAHGLGVYLPANSIIARAFFYVVTQFTDSGTGSIALSCEDAGNIYAGVDITTAPAGFIQVGIPTGTVSTFVKSIAARCEITATVAGTASTAGKLNLFVEYFESN